MNVSATSSYMDKVISISQFVQGRVLQHLSGVSQQVEATHAKPLKPIGPSGGRVDITI